jgi:hypothetical protein
MAISTASMTVGSKPVTTPKITFGIELMKLKNGIFVVRKLMFDIRPTIATGMDLFSE